MRFEELSTKSQMLDMYYVLKEMYPSLSKQEYSDELDDMLPNNYGQVIVYDGDKCAGLTGYWIGTKLWCGKYMELDNVFIREAYRSKGIGEQLFDFMKKKGEKENCTMLALDTYTDNFKAGKFFYEQGYVPRGFHFINVLKKSNIR